MRVQLHVELFFQIYTSIMEGSIDGRKIKQTPRKTFVGETIEMTERNEHKNYIHIIFASSTMLRRYDKFIIIQKYVKSDWRRYVC